MLAQWAYGSDHKTLDERYRSTPDVATGAEVFQEDVLLSELAGNTLFALAAELEDSRPLLADHLDLFTDRAATRVSAARILAALGRPTVRPLRELLDKDPSPLSQVMTASAIALECDNPFVAERMTGLIVLTKSVRVSALVEAGKHLGVEDWEPLYGPLRTWSAEISLPLPSLHRRAAADFAKAVVSRLTDDSTNEEAFGIEHLADEAPIMAFAKSLTDKNQERIDFTHWASFGPWGQRWGVSQICRRLVRNPPDARGLTAILSLEPPGYVQLMRELHAHLAWIDQYAAEPSEVFQALDELLPSYGEAN